MDKPLNEALQIEIGAVCNNTNFLETIKKADTLDLARQVLNVKSNFKGNPNRIKNLFKYYNMVFSGQTSEDFKNSIDKSAELLERMYNMSHYHVEALKLKNYKPDSFLIVPLRTIGHLFAGVLRKNEEKFSLTIINKEEKASVGAVREAILDEKSLRKLWTSLDDHFILPSKFNKTIHEAAQKVFKLSVPLKAQKLGNCFIKEPETALRFAFSTRNFKQSDFEKIRSKNHVLDMKREYSIGNLHTKFIDKIIEQNPNMESDLKRELDIYLKNKKFRKMLKTGFDSMIAFHQSFENNERNLKNLDNERIKVLLGEINMDTVSRNYNQVRSIVKSVEDKEILKVFDKLNKFLSVYNFINIGNGIDIYVVISEIQRYFGAKNTVSGSLIDTISKGKTYFPHFGQQMQVEHNL